MNKTMFWGWANLSNFLMSFKSIKRETNRFDGVLQKWVDPVICLFTNGPHLRSYDVCIHFVPCNHYFFLRLFWNSRWNGTNWFFGYCIVKLYWKSMRIVFIQFAFGMLVFIKIDNLHTLIRCYSSGITTTLMTWFFLTSVSWRSSWPSSFS